MRPTSSSPPPRNRPRRRCGRRSRPVAKTSSSGSQRPSMRCILTSGKRTQAFTFAPSPPMVATSRTTGGPTPMVKLIDDSTVPSTDPMFERVWTSSRGRIDSINEEFADRYGWGGRIARGDEGRALDELAGVRSEPAGGAGAAARSDGTEAEPTGGGAAAGYYASGGDPAEALGAGSGLLGVQGPRRARPALAVLSTHLRDG